MKDRRFDSAEAAALLIAAALAGWTPLFSAPAAAAASATAASASAKPSAQETRATVPVESFTLDNGMKFLLVRRPALATVTAGWVAHVGSSNEKPGMTGISHLFEHMMFKGTHVLGTTNITRDLEIIDEQERLQEQIRAVYAQQRLRWRRGEIADAFDPAARPPELVELEKKFGALVEEQRKLMVKDEFDKIYTAQGGSQINAFTTEDMTVYFVTLPANKVEMWFWMESDRLNQPVFREFYSERDVVHEERRLSTESTPTGKFDELFQAMFWESHPYSWPVLGWPSDLRVISKTQADDYFNTYYSPNNLTAALVGNFDPVEVKALAQKYFGRIPRGRKEPPDVATLEMPQIAEKMMRGECDCQPQVQVAYHTVPFRHGDSYALEVLGGLLNGDTGRLRKSLILDKKIATSAGANQDSRKWAGVFTFTAQSKGTATPEDLEAAWDGEVKRIIEQPIPAEELQKVKNQIAAAAFRRLDNPFYLMLQLLVFDGSGDWTYLQDWAGKTTAVTEGDVKRVAKAYLVKENRSVGFYTRKGGAQAEEMPAELQALPEELRGPVQTQLKALQGKLATMNDPKAVQDMLDKIRAQKDTAPEPMKAVFPIFERTVEGRLKDLQASKEGGK
jgi:predicted Zn-dependent peptidase